jgi:hypothetical protein
VREGGCQVSAPDIGKTVASAAKNRATLQSEPTRAFAESGQVDKNCKAIRQAVRRAPLRLPGVRHT